MLTKDLPFKNVCDILSGEFANPKNVSQECCDLLRGMLVVDPQQRWTLTQIINSPWFNQSEQY